MMLIDEAAKTNYAICSGSVEPPLGAVAQIGGPPREALAPEYEYVSSQNGVSYQRSQVRVAQLEAGTSKVFLVGEKSVAKADYNEGRWPGDDQSVFDGYDFDTNRWTARPPIYDRSSVPIDIGRYHARFGSAHRFGLHVSFCDSHVEFVSYDVDSIKKESYGNRRIVQPR